MPKTSTKITKAASFRGLDAEYVPHSTFQGITKDIFSNESSVDVNTLYEVVKHSPEVNACILAQLEDVMSDYWKFASPSNSEKTSKGNLDRAKEFEVKSNYYRVLSDALFDLFVTGNAYILKLSVDQEKMKSIMEDMARTMFKKFKVKFSKADTFKIIKQETGVPKDLQLLKSSTVKINFDDTGKVASYQQKVKGQERIYQPEDVIHLSLVNIGGSPYGYSPLEPLLSDIGTLIFAKEFAGKYFENDGVPYFIFKMPDEPPNGRNYKLLKKELSDLKKKGEKYRSMVLTGNVDPEQVNKFNKDMEFAKLVEHFTQVIFMGLGVPATRVNYALAQKDATAAQAGKVEAGYYKKIGFVQKNIEVKLNRELWGLFNVHKKFNRAYKIDEMREAQIIQIATQSGIMTVEEARERIGMEPKIPKGQTMPQSLGDDKAIDFKQDKKEEQGIEKKPKDKTDNKLKSYMLRKGLTDSISVSFVDFISIVENRIGPGNFTKAKVLYLETTDDFILFFGDESWKYKSVISKRSIDPEQFRIERLRNFIKLKL